MERTNQKLIAIWLGIQEQLKIPTTSHQEKNYTGFTNARQEINNLSKVELETPFILEGETEAKALLPRLNELHAALTKKYLNNLGTRSSNLATAFKKSKLQELVIDPYDTRISRLTKVGGYTRRLRKKGKSRKLNRKRK